MSTCFLLIVTFLNSPISEINDPLHISTLREACCHLCLISSGKHTACHATKGQVN